MAGGGSPWIPWCCHSHSVPDSVAARRAGQSLPGWGLREEQQAVSAQTPCVEPQLPVTIATITTITTFTINIPALLQHQELVLSV